MVADATEHLAQERFGVIRVEFGRSDQAVERRSPIAAGVATGKEKVLAPQRDAA